jgi:hypothetical protein
MSWFFPVFWWRDSNRYLVFYAFTSKPTSLLTSDILSCILSFKFRDYLGSIHAVKQSVNLSLCCALHRKGAWGSGCIDPYFPDLGASCRWVVSFTPRPPVSIGYEAGWTPQPIWTTWRRENSWSYQDSNSEPSVVHPVASSYTDYENM